MALFTEGIIKLTVSLMFLFQRMEGAPGQFLKYKQEYATDFRGQEPTEDVTENIGRTTDNFTETTNDICFICYGVLLKICFNI